MKPNTAPPCRPFPNAETSSSCRSRRARQKGNFTLEFAISFALIWGLLTSVYGLGQALYTYNRLQVAVSNASRLAGRDGIPAAPATYVNRVKNQAVFGNPDGTGTPLVPGLTTGNIDVAIESDSSGVPRNVTVKVTSFALDGVFWKTTLTNKPQLTTRYAGRYQPYGGGA
jgi:Flp pilus assembly protein TadG